MTITPRNPLQDTAPCGSWHSSLTADKVAAGVRPVSAPRIAGTSVVWLEGLPAEGGRVVAQRWDAGRLQTLTPAEFNLRSRVHEYGGGACIAVGERLFFTHFTNGRVYTQQGDAPPQPLAAGDASTLRHADLEFDAQRGRLLAVREDHGTGAAEPRNSLVSLPAEPIQGDSESDGTGDDTSDDTGDDETGAAWTLAEGMDFYAAPRLSPSGQQLAWLAWNHPQMPWQGCELWLATVDAAGRTQGARRMAGGPTEALAQPLWSPQGELFVVSDRSGWWNLYRVDTAQTANHERSDTLQPVCPMEAEFARPMWVFGQSLYGFTADDEITAAVIDKGLSRLLRIRLRPGAATEVSSLSGPCSDISDISDITELRAGPGCIVVQAASATTAEQIIRVDVETGATLVLASSLADPPSAALISAPQTLTYPSAGGRMAHAFFHPPCNPDFAAPAGELPPLIVTSHGGPTSMSAGSLRLALQFWTSRGFAVLDVNYGGSSGFGRAYRRLLDGQWGVVDVEDCVAGAQFVAAQGWVDARRMAIRGSSASGFTTLCALAFHDVFAAGASHYGVSDLAGLDADTHKFESRYTATLVAAPATRDAVYAARSPLHHVGRIRVPMIFFQGLEDRVVPPSQSLVMVEALRAQGVPVAYHTYEGEGHGFRRQATIAASLQAELAFYGQVFGFAVSD